MVMVPLGLCSRDLSAHRTGTLPPCDAVKTLDRANFGTRTRAANRGKRFHTRSRAVIGWSPRSRGYRDAPFHPRTRLHAVVVRGRCLAHACLRAGSPAQAARTWFRRVRAAAAARVL